MGTEYHFRCDNCSLSAEVSGGPDSGMYAEWTTVWCPDCESLSDVTTASEDHEAEAEYRQRTVTLPDDLRCPNCRAKGLRTFDQKVCPKCGEDQTQFKPPPLRSSGGRRGHAARREEIPDDVDTIGLEDELPVFGESQEIEEEEEENLGIEEDEAEEELEDE